MTHKPEVVTEEKMAEAANEAELLKEKANNYFKGNLCGLS